MSDVCVGSISPSFVFRLYFGWGWLVNSLHFCLKSCPEIFPSLVFPLGDCLWRSCPPQKLDFWSFVLVALNSDSHGLLSAASFPRPWLSLTTNCSCYTFSCGSPTPRMSTGYKTSWAKCILKIWFFYSKSRKRCHKRYIYSY